ncbi:MAG: sigma 54-interacting transcriptional regulator, partial [Lentisphaerota bacterium]
VRNALDMRELQRENRLLTERMLAEELHKPEAFKDLITVSHKMLNLFKYIEAVAMSSQALLVTGETGVGKELVAHAVHQASGRKGEFVAVNIAGLDDNMFSDTLFGHVRGAFTGADAVREGLVQKAADGTLFLDEIGDVCPGSQVKLLRLLQEREYFALGADAPRRSTARVVTATCQTLNQLDQKAGFRKDLLYRLRAHHVQILPLRERKEDLPVLLDHFLEKAARDLDKPKPAYSPELLTLLATYHFPGNIRELESMVYDAISNHATRILSTKHFRQRMGGLDSQATGFSASGEPEALERISFRDPLPTLQQAEDLLVREALTRSQGNQTIAARLLGISRQALNQRLKRKEIL